MYAIIEDGGRQYKVAKGDTFEVDLRELSEGQKTLEFDRVLMIGDLGSVDALRVGQPCVEGAKVVAGITNPYLKGEKLTIQKFRRRKGYHLKKGHRQKYIQVVVNKIVAGNP